MSMRGVGQAVGGDVVDERAHLVGVLVEVGERGLEAHEEVALLEDAGAHEAGGELLAAHGFSASGAGGLPAGGAVGARGRARGRPRASG